MLYFTRKSHLHSIIHEQPIQPLLVKTGLFSKCYCIVWFQIVSDTKRCSTLYLKTLVVIDLQIVTQFNICEHTHCKKMSNKSRVIEQGELCWLYFTKVLLYTLLCLSIEKLEWSFVGHPCPARVLGWCWSIFQAHNCSSLSQGPLWIHCTKCNNPLKIQILILLLPQPKILWWKSSSTHLFNHCMRFWTPPSKACINRYRHVQNLAIDIQRNKHTYIYYLNTNNSQNLKFTVLLKLWTFLDCAIRAGEFFMLSIVKVYFICNLK